MPSAPSARLGLTSPLSADAPDGPANFAALVAQLEAAVGMARLSEQTSAGGAGAALTFATINQNFRHLRVVGVARSNDTSVTLTDGFRARLNGVSTATYDSRQWRAGLGAVSGADGSGITTTATQAGTFADLGVIANENLVGDVPAAVTGFTLELLDYAGAGWKTWLYRGVRASSSGTATGPEVTEAAGGWRGTAAVTDLSLFVASAGLDAISRATLYGLR